MKISDKLLFLSLFVIIWVGIILNYTIKIPNDGVLYLSAANFFLENNIIIDPTKSYENLIRKFPTSQLGITLYIIVLKYIFSNLWLLIYSLVFASLWLVLIKKLIVFSKYSFSKNNNFYIFFPAILFLNYDYLVGASSYYNETLYYPFLLFSFLKISNFLKKEKNIFNNSKLFIAFLLFGSFFRLQHFVFLASLALLFLIIKKKKEFFFTIVIILINIVFFFLTLYLLKNLATSVSSQSYEQNLNSIFYNLFSNQFSNFDINFLIKNLKVHLSLYTNFLNLPKLIDFNLPKNLMSISELIYFISSFIIVCLLIISCKKNILTIFKKFLLIYFIFTSIFLFLLTDYTTRYFLLTNFVIIFFICDLIKEFKFKLNLKKMLIPTFFYLCIFAIYFFGYLLNYNQVQNVYSLKLMLNDLNKNRANFYTDKDIYVSKFRYNIYWITKQPSIRLNEIFNYNLINSDKRFFYIGEKKDLKFYINRKKIKKIENYTYLKNIDNGLGIWRVYFK